MRLYQRWDRGGWYLLIILLGVTRPLGAVAAPVTRLPQNIQALQQGASPPCFDNTNRYVDCGNGTVTDTVTGLIWLADADCFGAQLYANAIDAAAALSNGNCSLSDGSFAGDWRLPTIEEWETTVAQAVALSCTNAGGNPPTLTDTAGTACFNTEVLPVFSNTKVCDNTGKTRLVIKEIKPAGSTSRKRPRRRGSPD